MIVPAFKFSVGSLVLHILHNRDHEGWQGIVTGREFYQDQDGSGLWYYVRWIKPEGEVSADKHRMPECELREAGAA